MSENNVKTLSAYWANLKSEVKYSSKKQMRFAFALLRHLGVDVDAAWDEDPGDDKYQLRVVIWRKGTDEDGNPVSQFLAHISGYACRMRRLTDEIRKRAEQLGDDEYDRLVAEFLTAGETKEVIPF